MTTKYQRPSAAYQGATALSNRSKYQDDAQAVPKVAISSTKIDGDFNYILDALNTIDEASGSRNTIDERISVILNDDGSLKSSIAAALDDWIRLEATGLTRVDNSTFSLNGSHLDVLKVHRRLRLNVGGTTLFATISEGTESGGITTISCVDITEGNGTIAVIDQNPTSIDYSPVSTDAGGNAGTYLRQLALRNDQPILRLHDTSSGGEEYALRANGSTLEFLENTGSEDSPVWSVIGQLDASGFGLQNGQVETSDIADDAVTPAKVAHHTGAGILGFESGGAPQILTLGTGVQENSGAIEATLATQIQAEAGTDTGTLMTPLRTKQAVEALASAGIEPINSGTFSASSAVQITSPGFDDSTYTGGYYLDVYFTASTADARVDIRQRIGGSYQTTSGYSYISKGGNAGGAQTQTSTSDTSIDPIRHATGQGLSTTAGAWAFLRIWIPPKADATAFQRIFGELMYTITSANDSAYYEFAAGWDTAGVLSGIEIAPTSGNITGEWKLRGIK